MSNYNPRFSSSSRIRSIEQQNFATGPQVVPSQAVPIRFRDQPIRNSARKQAFSMSWPSGDGSYFRTMHSPVPTVESSTTTAQTSPQHYDPTLAPEHPVDDSEFIAMLQQPKINPCETYIPHEMTFAAQSEIRKGQATPNAPVDMGILGAAEGWDYVPSDCLMETPTLIEPPLDLGSDFDLCDIDIGYFSAQKGVDHSATSIDTHQPELSSSAGTRFEILNGIQAFATGCPSPVAQYLEPGTLSVPGCAAHYPDPNDFSTPLSPTPDLISASITPSKQHGPKGAQRDTSTDVLLVNLRQGGKSYKQIKEILGLEEAESTLRGRYRTLIKPKEARVRKPEWTGEDVRLLFDGVLHFSNSNPIAQVPFEFGADAIRHFTNKVPWKQVAEWMEDQGTYKYGNATVKKKYLAELKKRGAPI